MQYVSLAFHIGVLSSLCIAAHLKLDAKGKSDLAAADGGDAGMEKMMYTQAKWKCSWQ